MSKKKQIRVWGYLRILENGESYYYSDTQQCAYNGKSKTVAIICLTARNIFYEKGQKEDRLS